MAEDQKQPERGSSEKGPLQTFFQTFQAALTCAAILVGAGWFFYQKADRPKANCAHKLAMVKVDNGKTNLWWGSLEVKVANVGQIPLSIKESALKVTVIRPVPDGWSLEATNNHTPWPQIFYRTNEVQQYVLPGEEDFQYFEFNLPIDVRTFRVFSFLKLGENSELAWSKVSIYNIENGKVMEVGTAGTTDK